MFWRRVEPGTQSPADEFFSRGRFALILAALICATYPEVIIGRGTFFHRDFAVFGYPLAAYHRECFWRGEIPLWNPLNHCGLPFLAQWNTMTLYPFSLFYLLLPLSWSLGVFCLGHLFLGGMGIYFLGQRWTCNRFAAAIAGTAYSFSALMLHSLMWPNNIAAMGLLPWVILAVERACSGRLRVLLLAVLAGTIQMLSGAPEIILLTWITCATMVAGKMWLAGKGRWKILTRFALIVLWVGAFASAQLLPFLDLLAHSQRDKSFADSMWSMPIWGWANFLVPLFRSFPTAIGIYAQPDQYWIPSYYLGVGIIAWALLAFAYIRQPRISWLMAITIGCLLLALGKNGFFYSLIKQVVPGLGFIRYPVKFVTLPIVLIPLLAAVSIARYLSLNSVDRLGQRKRIVSIGIVLLVVIGILIGSSFLFPLKGASAAVAAQSGITRALYLVVIIAGFLALPHFKRPSAQKLARLGLLACFWLDAITAGPRPNPTVPLWVYEPNLARKALHLTPEPEIGRSRLMLNSQAEESVVRAPLSNAVDHVLFYRLAFYANANLLDDVPKVVGMYSIFFKELGDVFSRLYSSPEPPAGLADFLGVSHINEPGKTAHWNFRPSSMEWITAGQSPVFADPPQTVWSLGQPQFDPRRIVFLPLDARSLTTVTNSTVAKISTKSFAAHKIEVEVEAAEPALVVVAQSFDHNWKAYVNGRPVRLLRANHAFQALEVPAGHHQVTLLYRSKIFYCGAVISLLSGVIWIAVYLRAAVAARR
jgi:hypothetical protein